MGAVRRIISQFTNQSRSSGATGSATSAGGSQHSQDAKIGRAVRSAVRKVTGGR